MITVKLNSTNEGRKEGKKMKTDIFKVHLRLFHSFYSYIINKDVLY